MAPPPRKRSPSPRNRGEDEEARLCADPSTTGSSAGGPPPRSGEDLRVTPNKNRLVQVRRTGGRKLFDAARREVFLEWFAATCNVTLSAAKADVCCQTVFRHRMKDPAFAADWDAALQQGYARLEARLLQEAVGASGAPSTIPSAGDGPCDAPSSPGQGARLGPRPGEDEAPFDAQLALQLLREHARRAGAGGRQKNQRTPARAAGNKEIAEALAKRLKGFALRQGSGQALRHSSGQALRISKGDEPPPPRKARSPSPGNPGEDE